MNDIALAWALFFIMAVGAGVLPKFLGTRLQRELSYLCSLLLWLSALYTWMVGFGGVLWVLALVHIVPVVLISGLLFVEIGESLGKRDKYD